MFNTLRRHITRAIIAAAAIGSLGLAGATTFAAHPAAAAPESFFKADIAVTPAFQIPVGGSIFYYFKLTNTGLSSGAVVNPQYRCGIKYHYAGQAKASYTYQYGLSLAHYYYVNAGSYSYLVAQCNAYYPGDSVVGIKLMGDLENNIGDDTFSVTVGYVPW